MGSPGSDGAASVPSVLLLSATPYRLLSTRWDESRGALAQRELLELVEFLAGASARERAKQLFADFGDRLRDIVAHTDTGHPDLAAEVREAASLRDEQIGRASCRERVCQYV